MPIPTTIACLPLAALLAVGAALPAPSGAAAQPASAAGPAARAAALESYEKNHWAQAYAAFVRLADEGDADAARIALQMHRHGPALYGQAFVATPTQRTQWAQRAAQQQCDAPCAAAVRVGAAGR